MFVWVFFPRRHCLLLKGRKEREELFSGRCQQRGRDGTGGQPLSSTKFMRIFHPNTQEQVLDFCFRSICRDKRWFIAGLLPKVDGFTLRSSGAGTDSREQKPGETGRLSPPGRVGGGYPLKSSRRAPAPTVRSHVTKG